MIDSETLQRFRAEVVARRNLPTIPPVLAQILSIVGSDTAGSRQLVELVERDQTLTAKLLRLANGAFFGQARRVATVPRAVLLLGFSTVRNLALGVKVWDAIGAGVDPKRLQALWDHSVAVAICARTLGGRLRACDPDEAFTAGVLHDIGRLVIATRFRQTYWDAGEDGAEPTPAAEQATFGVTHAEVGAWLLEAWRLPPTIVESIRLHHAPNPRGEVPGILALTDRLVRATDLATGVAGPEVDVLVNGLSTQGLTPGVWSELVADLRESGAFQGVGEQEPR